MQEAQGPLGEWENPSPLPIHRHPSPQSWVNLLKVLFFIRVWNGCPVEDPGAPAIDVATLALTPARAETGLGVG